MKHQIFQLILSVSAMTSSLAMAQTVQKQVEATKNFAPTSFGQALDCSTALPSGSVLTVAKTFPDFSVDKDTEAWVLKAGVGVGFPTKLPTDKSAKEAALLTSAMLKRGFIVASKMSNDEATLHIPAYKKSTFSRAFDNLLTVYTQPIMHDSDEPELQPEGRSQRSPPPRSLVPNVDPLQVASASLLSIVRRSDAVSQVMGSAYEMPSIRFYLLANGFHDSLALAASKSSVCGLGLSIGVIKKLNASARYMAMPAAPSGQVEPAIPGGAKP